MYSSEDFGPVYRRPGRRFYRALVVGGVAAGLVVLLFFREPVVTRFRVWRLRSGSPEAKASAWRGLVESGRADEALTRLAYVEVAPYGTDGRYVPAERSSFAAVPRIDYLYVTAGEDPAEDHVYVKLLNADETIFRYVSIPPEILIWGRASEDAERRECNHVGRLVRNPEHYAIQLADSVEYALDVNTPNQVMRIRLRRSPLSEQRFHVKFTPLSRRSRPEVKAFIRSAKLSLTDAASPEPGNLVPWLAYGSDEESFFLAESEGTKRAGAERAKRLARLIDAANAEWRRSRGYVPMPRYRVDVIDSREWPRALKELAVVKDAGRSAAAGREPVVHPDAKVYVVRPGDVLSKIASRHGTTVEALVRANNLRDPDRLRVGQKLVIVKP